LSFGARSNFVVGALLIVVACGQSIAPENDGALGGAGGVSGQRGSSGDSGVYAVGGASIGATASAAGTPGVGGTAGVAGTVGGSAGAVISAGGMVDAAAAGGDASGAAGMGGSLDSDGFCPPKGTPCKIMPLGDSITFGYGSTAGGGYRVELFNQSLQAGKAITFVGSQTSGPSSVQSMPFPRANEGHSGYSIDDSSNTSGIAPLVDQAIAKYRPNIVLLQIGTNDMHYSLDLVNAPARLGKLIDQITKDAPNALVVVAKIPPANGSQNTPTIAYNAAIEGVLAPRLKAGKHLVLVDNYAPLAPWSTARFKDSEHPNDVGYAAIAHSWYAAIEGTLR